MFIGKSSGLVSLYDGQRRLIAYSETCAVGEYYTTAKALEHIRRLGIVREVTGRERHRLIVYEPYLAILNEGTEPIR